MCERIVIGINMSEMKGINMSEMIEIKMCDII